MTKKLTEEQHKRMMDIVGYTIDYDKLEGIDVDNSMHPEAIKYRVALARLSNAIEGVILPPEDREFMDNLPLNISDEEANRRIKEHFGWK